MGSRFQWFVVTLVLCAASAAQAGSYTVTTTADSGAGSLRQGILDANSATCTSPCTIQFDATLFATTQTINTASNLSITASNVTIDGFANGVGSANNSAFGSSDNSVQRVVVNGPSTTCCPVITISGSNVTIRGLVIQDGQTGITVSGTGSATIAGCKIGTNALGTAAVPNLIGISVSGTSPTATIGGSNAADRNLISGNSGSGISLASAGNVVIGNYIGTTALGSAFLANATGVSVSNSNNTVGNTSMGNVISGNTGRGIDVLLGTGTAMGNNRIGTNISGTAAVANNAGIFVGGGGTPGSVSIGGTGQPNLISGNTTSGIEINNSSGSNIVSFNFIGLNDGSSATIPNGGTGIVLTAIGSSNTITNNRIGGNAFYGMTLNGGADTTIQNNFIGYVSGTPRPNGLGGVRITAATGTTTVFANSIRNNGGVGVDVDGVIIGVAIKQNEIADNTGIGIDLKNGSGSLGATANDAGDTDTGAGNHLQNFPAITSASVDGPTGSSTLTLKFNVDSANVGTTLGIRAEAFKADTDPTNPEGLTFLQGQCFASNNISNATMTIPTAGVAPGDKIVMTATSYTNTICSSVNEGTSEFSPGATVAVAPGFVINTNNSGAGSLRQAITDANSGACASPCAITFNIPNTDPNFSGGVYTIRPTTALPDILASNTTIDGATQTVFGGDTNLSGPEIVINGSLITGASAGLQIAALTAGQGNNIAIRNVVVNGFPNEGIFLDGSALALTNISITGNYVGTDPTGTSAVPNATTGIYVGGLVSGAFIGTQSNGNLISGNTQNGIILDGASGNFVQSNIIGLNASGTAALPNGFVGIQISGAAQNNTIGGGVAGTGNTVSGNLRQGIAILDSGTNGNVVQGNYIGTDTSAGTAIGNGWAGIGIWNGAQSNTIGGTTLGEGNVISGNGEDGVAIRDLNTSSNILAGNYIGTNASGFLAVPNGWYGVDIFSAATNNTVGGSVVSAMNVISGNTLGGVLLSDSGTTGNVISANRIGLNGVGSGALANLGPGVLIAAGASGNTLGGGTVAANAIAHNGAAGVAVTGASIENNIRYNSIFSNTGLGIDLANNGVTANDAGDGDSGPNALQNFPILAMASYNSVSNQTTISGTLNSLPSTQFDIDWYSNTALDGSGHGEGEVYETTSTFTTDALGNANVSIILPGNRRTSNIVATASRVNGPVRETSEFSATAPNNPPVANNDTPPATNEDTPTTFDPRANDSDPEGGTFTITSNTQPSPSAGSVTCSATSCTFTPVADYNGPASFNYTITDDLGATATATVNITVNAVNDPPVANTDAINTSEDTQGAVNVLTNDTDVDGPSALSVTGNTNGANGTAVCSPIGNCTYTPNPDFNGADSFTYTVSDSSAASVGTVNVTVNATNDPPVANPDAINTTEDTPNSVNVLTNDTDVDGPSALTVTGNTNGTKGNVVCTAAGGCTYTPNPDENGADSFTYTVSDGVASTVGTVNVNISSVNDPPVANTDGLGTTEDTPNSVNVLANDTDVDGPSALTVTGNTNGTKGTAVCTAAGSCTYTPNPDQTGTDSFTYTVSDGLGSSVGTVNVNITATNDPPLANPDTINTAEDSPGSVNVLTNDTDVDGPSALSVTGNTNGTKGSAVCTAAGNCTYTPNPNQNGADSFTYTVSDGSASSVGTVNVNIGSVNDPPVANADALTTNANTPGSVNVLTNDTDIDGPSPLTVTGNTNGTKGTATCTAAGNCTYTPNLNESGGDSFTYTVFDGASSATGTVSVTIGSPNSPPNAVDDFADTVQNTAVTINVLANDSDPESQPLTLVANTQPANGGVSCQPDGNCTYTPNSGFTGVDSFTYTVQDSVGATSNATVAINVSGCPEAPAFLSPAPNATGVRTTGRLSWDNTGADSYNVYLGRADGDGCDPLIGSTLGTSISYANLEPNTRYLWRVEAVRQGCQPASSACVAFTTGPACNVSLTLVKPLGGTVASPIEFEWQAVSGATAYTVFAKIGGGDFTELGTTTSTKLTASLGSDGSMEWFVIATIPGCGNVQSPVAAFNLCNRPGRPLARVVGEATSGQLYRVEWDAVPNAVRYEVDQATNAAFTGATTISTTDLFVAYRHELTNGAQPFHYRVRAFTACTPTAGDYSVPIRIVIIPIPDPSEPNPSTNVPAGSEEVVVQTVFIPGEPGQNLLYTATTDRPWLTVRPQQGVITPAGINLEVIADPKTLPNGTFTASIIVTITDGTSGRIGTHGTTVKTTPFSINLVTPVSPVASKPATSQYALIIPTAGHLDGVNSHWQSDIRVTNAGFRSARYQLTFTPSGGTNQGVKQTNINVDAGATTALDDIVRNWFGLGTLNDGANGMLEILPLDDAATTSLTTVASSRTYNVTGNGTLGQYIPAVPFPSFIGRALPNALPQVLSLQQIAQSAQYRTNVGLAEAGGASVNAVLSVFNSGGSKLAEIPVELAAGQQLQMNQLLATRGIQLNDGRIEVKVTGGDGKITAYASVVDSATQDPLLVSGTPLSGSGSTKFVLPGVANLDNAVAHWRTDMRVFNYGTSSQSATLTFFPFNNGPSKSVQVSLPVGQVMTLDNVLTTQFGSENTGGVVHLTTANPASLVVTGRTYNQTANGTLGQFVPAVTVDQAVGVNERTLHILQVEDSTRYRTNVGLAEVTGKPVTVEMQVVLPDSKITPTIQIPLAANEFRQFNVIRDLGVGNVYNARITVRVIDGQGRVTAYGSVIDEVTQDPTYVPAQ